MPWNAESATSSMSMPLKSSTKWPAMIHKRILWIAWERVGRPVEVPDRRRGAEAHGQVERKGDAGRAGDKGPRVRRVPDGPLPVGVQHVVPEHPGAHLRRHADQCHQTPDHVDVVVDKVVRRHVVCTHRGVVAGASPILRPAGP